MKKLIIFAAAILMAGGASVYAQSTDNPVEHTTAKHRQAMAAHARMRVEEPGTVYRYRGYQTLPTAPSFGGYGYGPYGVDDDAEGRTSGG